MSVLGWILLWTVFFLALFRGWTSLWTRILRVFRTGDEIHRVLTEDGWHLALHRYRPKSLKFRNPVLLLHGMGANRASFDLDEEMSFARSLAARGFDTWCLELRGAGLSDGPSWGSGLGWGFDFDDHQRYDLPAALKYLAARSQAARPLLVGHSMGGLLALVHAGLRPAEGGPKALALISAPVKLDELKMARRLGPLLRAGCLLPAIYFRALGRFFAPFMGAWLGPLARIFVQPDSGMDASRMRKAVVNLAENTSSRLISQFISWSKGGDFASRDGQDDYRAAISRVNCPVLILSGQKDPIAPPDAVAPAYQWVASEDKRLRLLGEDAGDDVDFGHGDIMLGDAARELVHEEILCWLEERAEKKTE